MKQFQLFVVCCCIASCCYLAYFFAIQLFSSSNNTIGTNNNLTITTTQTIQTPPPTTNDVLYSNRIACQNQNINVTTSYIPSEYDDDSTFFCKWSIEKDPSLCFEQYLCSPCGHRWVCEEKSMNRSQRFSNITNLRKSHVWTGQSACAALQVFGVKNVYFLGDSYMRHIYIAMILLLSGNYKNGGLNRPEKCSYSHQFSEKSCRDVPLTYQICGLTLHLAYTFEDLGKFCESNSSLVIWSFGNHPIHTRNGREGINNADGYIEAFGCNKKASSLLCPVVWMSTHHRLVPGDENETPARVEAYNLKMRSYMENAGCGKRVKYVDVFNMTKALAHDHHDEARYMTYDESHWGMVVNLNKVQHLLSDIFLRKRFFFQ